MMDPDPPRKTTNTRLKTVTAPMDHKGGVGNLVACVMCVVCVTASVYNGWREANLQSRLNVLEDRVAVLETKSIENVDVLVERFRREADTQFRRRVTRELNVAGSRVLVEDHIRTTREVPECVCPAGMFLLLLMKYSPVY